MQSSRGCRQVKVLFCWQRVIVFDVSFSTISLNFISASISIRNGRLTVGSGCSGVPRCLFCGSVVVLPTLLFLAPSPHVTSSPVTWTPLRCRVHSAYQSISLGVPC